MRALGQVNRKRGRIGAAAHAVIARAEAAADDHGDLGHLRGGDRGDQLGAVLGDALGLVLAADHEAGDVLQEQQRDAALAGELDEMRALLRALGEQHAVVGEDRHRHAPDMREAADQRAAVVRLELVELAAVDQPGDDLVHVVGRAHVLGDDRVELLGIELRRARLARCRASRPRFAPRWLTMSRTMVSACSSFSARWSTTPDFFAWRSPPPRSSAVISSPVAAFTSGGPARKIVPCSRTITLSSLIAGT